MAVLYEYQPTYGSFSFLSMLCRFRLDYKDDNDYKDLNHVQINQTTPKKPKLCAQNENRKKIECCISSHKNSKIIHNKNQTIP